MSRLHVDHKDLVRFAEDKVNLPRDKATVLRAQAARLREKLEKYLDEHPDFTLKRMQLSGSLAKGTALRSLNDIDVAVYISGADTPKDVKALLEYLADRLRKAFPNFTPDQVERQQYSVKVHFKGTELDVDVVPILYSGLPDWRGNLVSQEDGSFLETSIPLHLDFAKKRKKAQPQHFAQVVRLVKHWAKRQKTENDNFRLKSFMTEMILAKLSDQGVNFSDYPEALQTFFTYIIRSGMEDKIFFTDNYKASEVGTFDEPIQIIDPVNPTNNVARLYNAANVSALIDAASEAGDAIDAALAATTKEKTVYYWQKVFGPTFNV